MQRVEQRMLLCQMSLLLCRTGTPGKQVDVKELFPDVEKFVKSVTILQKTVGVDLLSERSGFV